MQFNLTVQFTMDVGYTDVIGLRRIMRKKLDESRSGWHVRMSMGANPGGATGAIAPPRICHEGLNIA